jgi:hypothetical protein
LLTISDSGFPDTAGENLRQIPDRLDVGIRFYLAVVIVDKPVTESIAVIHAHTCREHEKDKEREDMPLKSRPTIKTVMTNRS